MKTKSVLIFFIFLFSIISCGKPPSNTSQSATTIPVVASTTLPGAITATSAISGGSITSDGGLPISARGVCWSTSINPTIANASTVNGTGIGTFSSTLSALSLSTTYYVRAYATNALGTAYGNEVSFTTLATVALPTISTALVTSISSLTATSGGNIISDGGAPITSRGICWSTSANPTIQNSKTADGTGTGSFTSNITGLTENTFYYLRAYAVNSAGIVYGNEITFTTPPTPQPGTVYIGSSNKNFYALNAITGQLKWKFNSGSIFSFQGPCYADGKIYAGSYDNYLYCMDTLSGNIIWRFYLGNFGSGSDPVYDNGTIYFGSNDHYLYALDANTGIMKWRFAAGNNVEGSPVVNNGIVYFGCDNYNIYAVNANTGQLLWTYATGGMTVESGPAIANGLLYLGARDGNLYAINISNGTLAWRYSTNNISLEMSSPTVVNNIVYIGSYHDLLTGTSVKGSLYAINATTGQLIWERFAGSAFNSSPVIANGKLFVTTESGEILAVDPATGNLFWSKTIYSNGASPAVMNGIVYVGSTDNIYALDAMSGVEKWKFPISNGAFSSGPCIVTSNAVKYSGKSGMQQ